MKVCVINGSPKGKYSITLQTILYIEKHYEEDSFTYIDAGSRIKLYEKDFSEAADALKKADLIIFDYPVYTFIVPSQLHRFIELIKENNIDLKNKPVTQFSTSKHFYDVTAHNFIKDNCMDLDMHYIKGLSADMDDLLSKKGQKEALSFYSYVRWCVQNDIHEPMDKKVTAPRHLAVDTEVSSEPLNTDKKSEVVIVADLREDDTQLKNMIDRFRKVIRYSTRIVNIRDFEFKGGCISCFNCAVDGKCIYTDGFDSFLRDNIQSGSAIVVAYSIKDHSMGSLFKTYDDRQFCNGHRTVTTGMPFGYLVSGNLSEETNLKLIMEARAEVGGNFLAGIATDEFNPNSEIDDMAHRLEYAIENKYTQPSNFYGVGGMKIFRDLIWLMQGMMKADHKFYKSHGQYDFPQKKRFTMYKMYLVGALISNPKIKAKMGNAMNDGMIGPYKKILNEE